MCKSIKIHSKVCDQKIELATSLADQDRLEEGINILLSLEQHTRSFGRYRDENYHFLGMGTNSYGTYKTSATLATFGGLKLVQPNYFQHHPP